MLTFDIDRSDAKQLMVFYLMSCYLYYELDLSPMPDTTFDAMCKRLLKWREHWIDHPHSVFVDEEALEAGTGHHLVRVLPEIVKGAAIKWYGDMAPGNYEEAFNRARELRNNPSQARVKPSQARDRKKLVRS